MSSLKLKNSSLYVVSSVLKTSPKFFTSLIWNFLYSRRGDIATTIRFCIVKARAKNCGTNIKISNNVLISGLVSLEIGNNVNFFKDCYIDATGGLIIGSNVSINHQTSILTTGKDENGENLSAPINIGDNAWIGGGAKLLPGVNVGTNAVIQPGSIVFTSVAPSSVVRGNPAIPYKN